MNTDLIQLIVKKKIPCVFVSPHLDDAVLSCGGLMEQLYGKTSMTVVNVFTKAHASPYTLSQRQMLRITGNEDAVTLYEKRRIEDKKALSHLGINIVDLGLFDALFRKKKYSIGIVGTFIAEFDHLYPTYKWHVMRKIAHNDHSITEIKNILHKEFAKNTLIFAPLGIGNHVDHLIVRKAVEALKSPIIYYSDFPYNISQRFYGDPIRNQEVFVLNPSENKNKLIKMYTTQFQGLFPQGKVPIHKEVYFVPSSLDAKLT